MVCKKIGPQKIGLQKILQNPPPDKRISEKESTKYIKYNNKPAIELDNYPRYTQAVERCVKLVSDAPGAVSGQKQRYEFISTRISLRQSMPNFETKTQCCV